LFGGSLFFECSNKPPQAAILDPRSSASPSLVIRPLLLRQLPQLPDHFLLRHRSGAIRDIDEPIKSTGLLIPQFSHGGLDKLQSTACEQQRFDCDGQNWPG